MKNLSSPISQTVKVTRMTIESLSEVCHRSDALLEWNCPFIHPAFLTSWWKHFRNNWNLLVLGIKENDRLSGIIPLMEQSGCARFIGSPEVCDYQDVITTTEKAQTVLTSLFNHLKQTGITRLRLGMVRPDSFVYRQLNHWGKDAGIKIVQQKAGVFYELKLPDTWESFLGQLSGKQRHEVRRKFRRLDEAGDITFRCIEDESQIERAMETFFFLFKANRPDKNSFMTEQMASFFVDMAKETAKAGLLKLFFLDIDKSPAASVFCFDFGDRFYLYNNGYDYRFQKLGVGFLSKFFSIQTAIESGKKIYDFLKGDEAYKERMGGHSMPLYDFEVFLCDKPCRV